MEKIFTREILVRLGVVFFLVLSFFVAVQTVKAIKEYRYVGYDAGSSRNTIAVVGTGEVFAVPDVATFSFTVAEEAKTVPDAQSKATAKMNAALKAVKDSGIEDKDIKTVGYNVYPKYEYRNVTRSIPCTPEYCPPLPANQVIVGYEVSQTIEVKVRDTEKAGTILSAVGATGVSNVSSLNFAVDDEDEIRNDARSLAIKDAREEAERLAQELGVSLGRIVQFTESADYPIYFKSRMSYDTAVAQEGLGGGAAPSVPTGENKVISNVQVTYEIR